MFSKPSCMRRPCFTLVLCVLLSFGPSPIVQAEDVPQTADYESETLPYLRTVLCSIAAPRRACRTTLVQPTSFAPKTGASSPSIAAVRDVDAQRSADVRVALALVCTLRC